MPAIVVERVFPQSAHTVWEELRHIGRHVLWMTDAEEIIFHSAQVEGVGTTFDCLTKIGPLTTRDVMTITRWDHGVAMGVTHRGLFTGRGEFTLTSLPEGTRLTWREDLRFPWWAGRAVGAAVARPIFRALWKKNLASLGRLLVEPHDTTT